MRRLFFTRKSGPLHRPPGLRHHILVRVLVRAPDPGKLGQRFICGTRFSMSKVRYDDRVDAWRIFHARSAVGAGRVGLAERSALSGEAPPVPQLVLGRLGLFGLGPACHFGDAFFSCGLGEPY